MTNHQQRLLVAQARGWIADSFDDVDAFELTDSEVIQGVQRHYDGGWAAFLEDVA